MSDDEDIQEWKKRAHRAEKVLANLLTNSNTEEGITNMDMVSIVNGMTGSHAVFIMLVKEEGVQICAGYPEEPEHNDTKELINKVQSMVSKELDSLFKKVRSVQTDSNGNDTELPIGDVESEVDPGTLS